MGRAAVEGVIVLVETIIWGWICATYAGGYFKCAIAVVVVLGLLDMLTHRKDPQ
jgi:hypothetical protein